MQKWSPIGLPLGHHLDSKGPIGLSDQFVGLVRSDRESDQTCKSPIGLVTSPIGLVTSPIGLVTSPIGLMPTPIGLSIGVASQIGVRSDVRSDVQSDT